MNKDVKMKYVLLSLLLYGSSLAAPPSTPDSIIRGKIVYGDNCTACHGPNGEGDGPAGKYLIPHPRNLRKDPFKFGDSADDIFKTITNGYNQMPPFSILPENDRWALVHYVRSLRGKK
jgi:mono/diheme cytochrome c family protein